MAKSEEWKMEPDQQPEFFTLLDISKEIQTSILQRMNRYYWIRAEIARLNLYRQSGHCYPQLVEKKDSQVLAEIRSTIWANDFRKIQEKFRRIVGEELADGMTILCYARVNYHPLYGLSLQIADVDPSFSLGEMAKEKSATMLQLKAEGLWSQNKDLKLPLLPQRLAVISVESSKGYHDFRNIIDQNSWGYQWFHLLFPALLQGDKAVESISNQLERIARIHNHFDAVLIIRGGGGEVGMSCFDHYRLARAVASFPIPVITGIGHSTNETVVEMVAHTNSITPTDLAYGLVQHFHNFSVGIEERSEKITGWAIEMIRQERRRVAEVSGRAVSAASLFLERNNALIGRIQMLTTTLPLHRIKIFREKIHFLNRQLKSGIASKFREESGALGQMEQAVRLTDPANVLKRGYSVVRHGGKALKTTETIAEGDRLDIELYQGSLVSVVKSIKHE